MKKFTHLKVLAAVLAIVLTVNTAMAQAPQTIAYQAVIRNASGNIMPNKKVGLRFSIRDLTVSGTILYQETKTITTNPLGLFTTNIGRGTLVFGYKPLAVINWQTGSKFLQVEVDTTGGTTYTTIGNEELLSVPYAISSGDGVPVGSITAFAGDTSKIPKGWVLCDGRAVSRKDTFQNLLNIIGTTYGVGDGVSTFNLPDYRGMFLRGATLGSAADPDVATRTAQPNSTGLPGNHVGTTEPDAFQSHSHFTWYGSAYQAAEPVQLGYSATTAPLTQAYNYNAANGADPGFNYLIEDSKKTANTFPSSNSGGSSETRPKNIYVNYIIKY